MRFSSVPSSPDRSNGGFQELSLLDSEPRQRQSNGTSPLEVLHAFLVSIYMSILSLFSNGSGATPPIKIKNRSYTVIRQLGEGGFSFVYEVKESTPGVPSSPLRYALKRIRIQLPEWEDRVKSEIAAHNQVNSPNVLKLLDSELVIKNGHAVEGLLLLPLLKNGTVQDMIDNTPSGEFIPMKTILRVSVDVCRGLLAFHSHQPPLAFRDLKPANILIDDDGRGVLMDLGSVAPSRVTITSRREALALQELCAETVTAPYRAPELFDPPSESQIDEKTDVWALGCTIYAMAYRQSPFDGSMTAAVGGRVHFPSKPDPYGPGFRAFIQAVLSTEGRSRPAVGEVLRRLQAMENSLNYTPENL
ncbi:hypothetical protein SmJEL517_g01729 [Synchytrium microbalum]|uniref:non-specific serine/threonine protein kinase n=1 Tax=Synchytrium microbalum TaxID=1806994 RepID=A0A507C9C6_9FUNG|nr:uncharacterized protein SmJEL517_g01729 [Synchytrium microbalum]TPX35958.1 hypothetical protein SmJEL517_g01729 [Synchytrium microbalum]